MMAARATDDPRTRPNDCTRYLMAAYEAELERMAEIDAQHARNEAQRIAAQDRETIAAAEHRIDAGCDETREWSPPSPLTGFQHRTPQIPAASNNRHGRRMTADQRAQHARDLAADDQDQETYAYSAGA